MTNIDKLTTILRAELIKQSGLRPDYVRDVSSTYGAYLDQNDEEDIFRSIQPSDTLILFELQKDESESEMSETNENETIRFIKAFNLHLIIYGENSTNIATMLVARLRTEASRNSFLNKDIYIQSIENPSIITEFINNVVWIRNDIDIKICCEFTFDQSEIETHYSTFDKINIYKGA